MRLTIALTNNLPEASLHRISLYNINIYSTFVRSFSNLPNTTLNLPKNLHKRLHFEILNSLGSFACEHVQTTIDNLNPSHIKYLHFTDYHRIFDARYFNFTDSKCFTVVSVATDIGFATGTTNKPNELIQ